MGEKAFESRLKPTR